MNNTLNFAESELRRYSEKMNISPEISFKVDSEHFNKKAFLKFDSMLDDAFELSVKNGKGVIYATNSRSILLGVYRFLTLQGCRFIRPGEGGEFVPVLDAVKDVEDVFYAYTRHRGTVDLACYGGIETMLGIVDWLPKVMMNTYFTEFTDSFWIMKFAYHVGDNPYKQSLEVSRDLYNLWMNKLNEEIKKRGLIRHSAGHGWTIMLMDGIDELKTKVQIQTLGEHPVCTNPEILPLIKGKRTIWDNTPLHTHFCLSNYKARKKFTECVCEYSEKHPEVDYLHIWLGDGYGNFCECEKCAVMTPTDWYVKLLNEIDAELTKRGSKQKLVFLIYFELLYPPVTERIINEDRFTMLFCPIGRDFTVPYRDIVPTDYKPAWNNTFTTANMKGELYLKQLEQWKEIFHGDSLVFDYTTFDRFYFLDFSGLVAASAIADDSLFIKELGLNGRIECGSVSAAFPTPLSFNSMAYALSYGKKLSFSEFLFDAFGKDETVLEFFEDLRYIVPKEIIKKKRKNLTESELNKINTVYNGLSDFENKLMAYTPKNSLNSNTREILMEYLQVLKIIFEIIIKKSESKSIEDWFEEENLFLRNKLRQLEQRFPFTLTAEKLHDHFYHHLLNFLEF